MWGGLFSTFDCTLVALRKKVRLHATGVRYVVSDGLSRALKCDFTGYREQIAQALAHSLVMARCFIHINWTE